ncbi:hypothetical protein BRADI_2g41288v3, partial [Brachypodium distachyon]
APFPTTNKDPSHFPLLYKPSPPPPPRSHFLALGSPRHPQPKQWPPSHPRPWPSSPSCPPPPSPSSPPRRLRRRAPSPPPASRPRPSPPLSSPPPPASSSPPSATEATAYLRLPCRWLCCCLVVSLPRSIYYLLLPLAICSLFVSFCPDLLSSRLLEIVPVCL